MVRRLTAERGREKIVAVIKAMGDGDGLKKAFEKIYGEPYDRVVANALNFKVNR
jgi:hypothetical protein